MIRDSNSTMNTCDEIARHFKLPGEIAAIHENTSGNVNDTYIVSLAGSKEKVVFQRLSTKVFKNPQLVMDNFHTVTTHIREHQNKSPEFCSRWKTLNSISTHEEASNFVDSQGNHWRAVNFIANARTYENLQSEFHAEEAGRALGMFHKITSDLDPKTLHDTLPDFHVTPRYLSKYDTILNCNTAIGSTMADHCFEFINKRRHIANILEEAKKEEILPIKVIHGDPKLSNIMIDDESGKAVSIIDLDTLKPGLIHYDIGDCLRSACNLLGEETEDFGEVSFDTGTCKALLTGYQEEYGDFLSSDDYNFIYESVRLITFELGIRFFSDYLAGNVYFKTSHREHNLHRAKVQFTLTRDIEKKEKEITNIINSLQK